MTRNQRLLMPTFVSLLTSALVGCGGGGSSAGTDSALPATLAAAPKASAEDANKSGTTTATENADESAVLVQSAAAAAATDASAEGPTVTASVGTAITPAIAGTTTAPVGATDAVANTPETEVLSVSRDLALRAKTPAPVVVNPSKSVADSYSRTIYVNGSNPSATDGGSGTASAPYKTISAAAKNLRVGDDVVIAAGVYREWVVIPTLVSAGAQTRIRAQTPRTVTIKGSAEVAGWTLVAPGVYSVNWTADEPEQVFRAGKPLAQIGGTVFSGYPANPTPDLAGMHASEGGVWPTRVNGNVSALTLDSFTYDAASKRLYVKVSTAITAAEKFEVSARRHVLQAESASVLTIDGLDFAHSNTTYTYRQGAVKVQGSKITLKNLVIHDMDGQCVQLNGDDNSLLDSTIERCGQVGITGKGNRLTIANNQVMYGNTRGFNKWWEAGGMKLIGDGGVHSAIIRNNVVAYNAGDGIWVDWKNTGNLIENNTTAYNEGFGIHYEASQTGTIRGNRSYGNTMRGIYLFESANSVVEGNSAFGNAMEGIAVVDGDRSAADSTLKPFNNRVVGNTIAWNDFNRNWIQLVLPGTGFGSVSDRNVFMSEALRPRMSNGFMSSSNYPYERLDWWQAGIKVDALSTEQTSAMPAALKAALGAKRLIPSDQLPTTLATPGVAL